MYASRIRELAAEEPRQPPVVVPIALQVGPADRKVRLAFERFLASTCVAAAHVLRGVSLRVIAQMLMHERFSRPPSQDAPRAAATPDELIARAIALDEAANNSGAFAGALLVSFRPSHMPDSLALMHEHVLGRVKECA